MTEWIGKNTTLRGQPFSVDGRWFQKKIIDDMHPNLDVVKCSQIGLTECEVRKALAFLCRNRGVSVIFTLPNEDMYKRVSKTRVQPLVRRDKVFNTERDNGATRSMDLFQFGESFLYVTGCSEGDATSIPADVVFNDEVDLSPQNMLALFNSRLQDSDWKINQRFSTPSFPSYGIDMGYQASDQHRYLVRCDSCNHWNWPEFDPSFVHVPGLPDYIEKLTEIDSLIIDEIDIDGAYIRCEKCKKPLDLSRDDNREWVPMYPGRTHARGYHVTPFSTGRLPANYILTQLLKYKERDYLRGFYNTVLGMPYSDGNIRLEVAAIEACLVSGVGVAPGPDESCWMGIDMGQTCHIVVGKGTKVEQMHPFLFETVHVDDLINRVKALCKEFNIVGGAVDRHPYEPTAQALFDVTDGKIVPTEYRGRKETNLVYDEFKELSHAQVERTMMLDEVVYQIKHGNLKMSGYGHFRSVVIEHLRDMVRDEQPEEPATWKKLTGQDHFFHALGFLLAAIKIREVIKFGDKEDERTEIMAQAADFSHITPGFGPQSKKTLALPGLIGYT